MFEVTFKIIADVQEDGQGQHVFKIFANLRSDSDFMLFVSTTYYQEVYRILQAGDTLTVTFQTSKDKREVVAYFLEDEQWDYAFEVKGHELVPDLFPLIEPIYQDSMQMLQVGDTWTITYHVQRL